MTRRDAPVVSVDDGCPRLDASSAIAVSLLGGLLTWFALRGVGLQSRLALVALVVAFGLWSAYQERSLTREL